MTTEKRLEELYSMLYQFDAVSGNNAAAEIVKAPENWTKCTFIPFYGSIARLITECKAELDKKTNGNTSAVKRFYKSCLKNGNRDTNGIIKTADGMNALCNGYAIIKFNGNYNSIPESKATPDFRKNVERFLQFPDDLTEIDPASNADVKSMKAGNIAKYGKGNKQPVEVSENIFVNPDTWTDIKSILRECKVYVDPYQKYSPIYFIGSDGEKAMLLQVNH